MNAMLKWAATVSLACTMSTAALAQEVINFGIISTESAAEPEDQLGAAARRPEEEDRS